MHDRLERVVQCLKYLTIDLIHFYGIIDDNVFKTLNKFQEYECLGTFRRKLSLPYNAENSRRSIPCYWKFNS